MKGQRFLLAALSGFIALVFTTSSFAGDCWATLGPGGCISVPWGWYVEGNVGYTRFQEADFSGSTNNVVGFNIDVGYKFMPYFGIELGYTKYSDVSIQNGTIQNNSLDLAGRGIVPFGSFEAFGKLGIQYLRAQVKLNNSSSPSPVSAGTRNKVGIYLGVGGQYYLAPNLAVNIQWARARGDNQTGTLDLWSIGGSFIYG